MKKRIENKQLAPQAVQILVNHAIYQFGNSLSIIFVNLYLWRLTNSLWVNGLYNLIAILTQAATTFSIGKVAKKKGRTIMYRYGIFLTAFFYLCIVIVQEGIINHFYWFALIKGIAQGLYWVAYFTIVHQVSSNSNRHRYLGWNQIVMGGSNLLGPALAGWIISISSELGGYIIVFSLAFLMFVIATIGSFRIQKEHIHHRTYYMKYLPLMIRKKPNFLKALIGWFLIGFPQGVLMYIPPILIYSIFNDESVVGYLNVGFLGLSIISSYLISRFAVINSTRKYLLVAALGFTLSALFLIWDINMLTVILFMCISHLFKPLQANSFAAYYLKWIDLLPLKREFRVESVVLRETIINLGRGMGIIIFMIFSNDIDTSVVAYVIFIVMVIQMILPFLAKEK
ncbi:MFS transporter [Aquibacillus rhizosphaerae]|uniref:MFS transporter n=1 Tax=Aquibacillus rhizosphaerae TaxID=3051431 RepID=A0ABT7L6N8_9BACI|nr:MFS transporter [Aquibacillus sp. LR5S19]MDL4840276.1 MFS transporter [Aquibacillus sp. LR5S19]